MLIIVLVMVLVAAVLYGLVSGLIGIPVPPPTMTLGPASLQAGNATIPVTESSGNVDPSSLQIRLQANSSEPKPSGLPVPNGSQVSIVTGGHVLWVHWTDADGNGQVSSGDSFLVTGNGAALPTSTTYTFTLQSPDGRNLASVDWTTPAQSPLRLAFALVTDRPTYMAGDTVNVTITLTNVGNGTAVLQLPNPCSVVFLVYDDTRQVVFNSTAYWGCIQVVWNLVLEPGASQAWVYSWGLEMNNGTLVQVPGTYELVPSFVWGMLYQDHVVRTDTETITVSP